MAQIALFYVPLVLLLNDTQTRAQKKKKNKTEQNNPSKPSFS